MRRGFAREDLFVVVHELFQTDTVDFADVVLPATTTLEHYDLHKAYGHLYLTLSRPAIAPLGEARSNTEFFRLLAARMGLDHPSLRETDEQMARQAMKLGPPAPRRDRLRAPAARDGGAPQRARPLGAVRGGRLPDRRPASASWSRSRGGDGPRPAAGYVPPREGPTSERQRSRERTRSRSSRRPRTTS